MTVTDATMVSVACAAKLGDEQLIATVQRLLREEREPSARLLVHLGEVDARQLYRQHAFSSMFEYCVKALHLSEAEAYLRIGAARMCRRFPRVLSMFAAGELHLSALKLLAPDDLYLVLTLVDYHATLDFSANAKHVAKDLADLIVHGSINRAANVYGMSERTEDNPVPWYWACRKKFFGDSP